MTGKRFGKLILLAAVVIFIAWVANNTYWEYVEVPMPMKGEAASNPFYVAQRYAEALGARTSWDRTLSLPESRAVMVVSGLNWDLSAARRTRLEQWVESGGRLVVDGSLLTGGKAFERWSGITRDFPEDDAEDEEEEEEDEEENSENKAPEKVATILSETPCRELTEDRPEGATGAAQSYMLCQVRGPSFLRSRLKMEWALRDDAGIQALRVNVGNGSVTMINADVFRYRDFLEGDHAALFAAATQLRGGDEIRFVSEEEHSSLLALTWRYGAPVVTLVLLWVALALWRGGVRFGPMVAATETARRSLAEQIRSTGQFTLRFGAGESLHASAVRALKEAAVRRIPTWERLGTEERIATLARLTRLDAGALSSAINYTGARRSNELRSAIALLEAARRRILIEHRRSGNGN